MCGNRTLDLETSLAVQGTATVPVRPGPEVKGRNRTERTNVFGYLYDGFGNIEISVKVI